MPSHKGQFFHPRTAQFGLQSAKVLDSQHVRRIRNCQLTTFKTITACYEYRGRPGIANSAPTTEGKFYQAARVSRETVSVRGGVGHFSHGMPCLCFQGNTNLMNSFIRQREFLWKPVHYGMECGFPYSDNT